MLKKLCLIIILLLSSPLLFAACCTSQYSTLNGVIIVYQAGLNEDGTLGYGLGSAYSGEDEESKQNIARSKNFISHCFKNKTVYVAEFGKTPFKCNAPDPKTIDFSGDGGIGFSLSMLKSQKPVPSIKLQRIYAYDDGIQTISFKPLNYYHVNFKKLSTQEIRTYNQLAKKHFPKPRQSEFSTNRLLKNHVYHSPYPAEKTPQQYPMKYKQNNYEFIILPMFAVEDEQNSDLMSAVFIKKGNKTQYSGELGGCISRIGADIDNDGFSEIITMQCESGEGDHKGLSKLYPKVIDMNYIGG